MMMRMIIHSVTARQVVLVKVPLARPCICGGGSGGGGDAGGDVDDHDDEDDDDEEEEDSFSHS